MSIDSSLVKRGDHITEPSQKRRRLAPSMTGRMPKIYPLLGQNLDPMGKCVEIHGVAYKIEKLAEGKFHQVFEFVGEELVLGALQPSQIILKSLHPLKAPKQRMETLKTDIAAYLYLLKENVPQPRVYVRPDQFEDMKDPKYGDFWILEKMERPALLDEPYVLEFVRRWVTKSIEEQREIIFDFYPRNIMVKKEQCYVVDPSLPDDDEREEWLDNLFKEVIAWSNGKEETYQYLTANFDKKYKELFDAALLKEKAANQGQFPVKSQKPLGLWG